MITDIDKSFARPNAGKGFYTKQMIVHTKYVLGMGILKIFDFKRSWIWIFGFTKKIQIQLGFVFFLNLRKIF